MTTQADGEIGPKEKSRDGAGAHPLIEPVEIEDGQSLAHLKMASQTHAGFDKPIR
jgi:hypothetical protein